MEMGDSVHVSESISVRIIRGAPWYKRSLKTLFEDTIYPVRERLHRWRNQRAAHRDAKEQAQNSSSVVREAVFFDVSGWTDTPAVELLYRQLSSFEAIVQEAEARFLGEGPSVR